MPSYELQEELSAAILRQAGKRFRKRMKMRKSVIASIEEGDAEDEEDEGDPLDEDEDDDDDDAEDGSEELRSSPSVSSFDGGLSSSVKGVRMEVDDDDDDNNEEDASKFPRRAKKAPETYDPIISADEELSYKLLRAPVRHILSQLDKTLQILHNSRIIAADYASASDSSPTEDESDSQAGSRRRRGRPRTTPQPGESATGATAGATGASSTWPSSKASSSRRGRPKKVHVPLDGETEDQMLLRIARESHRRLPATVSDRDIAFEEWLRKGEEEEKKKRAEAAASAWNQGHDEDGDEVPSSEMGALDDFRWLRRLGLRDWSDVVGAAALAGFSDQVIARTAKRCADLFGESMVIRRLEEAPVSRGAAFQTLDYRPEKIQLSDSQGDDNDDYYSSEDDLDTNARAKASSLASPFSREPSTEPRLARANARASPHPQRNSRSRSRSRSRSSAGLFLCPVPLCERANAGFSRRQNLRRHMQLVHPGVGEDAEDADSEDELVGAIHVDNFLKPIFPTKGWREFPTATTTTTTTTTNKTAATAVSTGAGRKRPFMLVRRAKPQTPVATSRGEDVGTGEDDDDSTS